MIFPPPPTGVDFRTAAIRSADCIYHNPIIYFGISFEIFIRVFSARAAPPPTAENRPARNRQREIYHQTGGMSKCIIGYR